MGYLNLVNTFVYKDPVFRAKLDALAENDAFLKDNGWNTSTKTIFYQASVPTGWTQDVSQNDKFLRVVSSTGGGSGGSKVPSSTITLAHSAHSITNAPNHTHDVSNHTHILDAAASNGNSSASIGLSINAGYLYYRIVNSSGSLTEVQARNLLNSVLSLTSGSAGLHNHGGNTTGSALTDIKFAYTDVIVGTKDVPGGTYTDMTTYFHSGDKIDFDPFTTLATNDKYNHDKLTPSGTIVVFGQATAPLGWTKIASTDDSLLRVVSGTGGGTGGSYSPSAQVTMSHTHSVTTDTGHTHTVGNHSHSLNSNSGIKYNPDPFGGQSQPYVQADGSDILRGSNNPIGQASRTAYKSSTLTDGSGNTDANASHQHTIAAGGTNFTLAYVDIIQASKDSAGSPDTYTDLTSGVYAWKKLVSKQRLNKLAANDSYIFFHTPESGTKAFFFMATVPITWTKITAQNDKGLRIVSGSSGGSAGGGTQLMSAALPLAHTHTISAVSHTHAVGAHTHVLDSASQSQMDAIGTNGFGPTGSNNILSMQSNTGSTSTLKRLSQAAVGTSDSVSHDHGGITGSVLTNVTLAYADVLYAQKD